MRVFQIREDQLRKKTGYIDTIHQWGLPGVICSVCNNTWSTIGLEYPSVDLTNFIDEKLYREARPEPLTVYQDLRQKIADAFPGLPVLEPGAEFGPSVGKAVGGRLNGFIWSAWWRICLELGALEKLRNTHLLLPDSVKAELRFKNDAQEIFEFDLPLRSKLINGVYDGIQLKYCDACGRDSASKPDEILIDSSSIPNNIDIFRVSNFRTIILVTERFVETVKEMDIKGAIFEEVKTV